MALSHNNSNTTAASSHSTSMDSGPDSILTWATSSSTIQGNSSLTMARDSVAAVAVATSTSSTKANTPEEDITILVVVVDLPTVEEEKGVAVVDEVAFRISHTGPTKRSCRKDRSI